MQSMQRSIGRMIQKSPGDNAKTAVLLKDYDDAEQLLTRVCLSPLERLQCYLSHANAQPLACGTSQLMASRMDGIGACTAGHCH